MLRDRAVGLEAHDVFNSGDENPLDIFGRVVGLSCSLDGLPYFELVSLFESLAHATWSSISALDTVHSVSSRHLAFATDGCDVGLRLQVCGSTILSDLPLDLSFSVSNADVIEREPIVY